MHLGLLILYDGDGGGDGDSHGTGSLRQVSWLCTSSFHKLRVFHRPKASRGKRYSSRSAALTSAALSSRFSSRLSSGLKRALNNSVNVYSNSEDCRQ
jgi:hypothetical protein